MMELVGLIWLVFEVMLSFDNVSNFRIDFAANGLQQILGFDILDASEDGMESINFQIEDYEDGIIGFNCETIEIVEVGAPGRIFVKL
ncbi:hypothetical protein SAMN05660461_5619 [Chitinophaga ginsengisegetis]|uniref:Uncharacterized protein n=1 Tax=Chitinophaga ginsengisegetis TaxID=393003 RepID=A0A1T5PAT8_9BACT|nr:hypothetical protein [Chitinophaga ginsengisegetis]SKD09727.1 hypothetical protein SAMN05660461_5619 [Chitinophaga ginsengisegetis]